MTGVNWWLVLLALALGSIVTIALTVRRVQVRTAAPAVGAQPDFGSAPTTEIPVVRPDAPPAGAAPTERFGTLDYPTTTAATAVVAPRSAARRTAVVAGVLVGALLVAGVTWAALNDRSANATQTEQAAEPAAPILASTALLVPESDVADVVGSAVPFTGTFVPALAPFNESALIDAPECYGAWAPLQQVVLGDTEPTRAATRILQSPDPTAPIVVFDGVVSYPSRDAAQQVYQQQLDGWRACAGRSVTTAGTPFVFGDVVEADGVASIQQQGVLNPKYGCDRAMTVRNNILIEARACRTDVSGQAVDLVNAIAPNIPN